MTAVGGPIIELSLSGRYFSVAEDAESNRKLGGTENEVSMNGDGTARLIKTRVPWSADGLTVSCADDNGDQEFLQNLADEKGFFAITVGYATGSIFQGNGQITGEIAFSSKQSTATVALQGTGTFTKQ
ncbi:MAG: hypothetical protein GY854_16560 [Deltaproteobacteria bacterium]|nr:hypothetical protein [Deltaproteobacteria bacterium]